VAVDVEPPAGVALRELSRVVGLGPAPALVELADWAAWRWAGRPAHFLGTASPPTVVRGLPPARAGAPPATAPPAAAGGVPADGTEATRHLVAAAFDRGRAVLRLPPAAALLPVVLAVAERGPTLVVAPSLAAAVAVADGAAAAGADVAALPRGWARAAAGAGVVVGARAAAWGPVRDLAAVVVLDEHDEAHQEEGSPTWHARDVALERAGRAGVPCVLTSPCPSLEALAAAPLVAPSRSAERAGWPMVELVDRRKEDPLRSDLYSARLVTLARGGGRVVCVLNRRGRVRLLACAACRELARCEVCASSVEQTPSDAGVEELRCRRCGTRRPPVCTACGATRLRAIRLGVSRAREDLERLARVPVGEVTGDAKADAPLPDATVLVGTEAVLHRVERADVVAFLDFDQELLAPRYRAAEQALALLARAARLVGGRAGAGRLLIQTRQPHHEVLDAALHADPGRLAAVELERRRALRFPPAAVLAEVGGAGAPAFVAGLPAGAGVEALGPSDGRWLLRAPDHRALCDALAATPRPSGRLRLAVDPPRV
jgi:primosomal protein N' (replication factor Y)